jgi:hypothetical protein
MSRKTFLFTSRIVATFLRKNIAGALQADLFGILKADAGTASNGSRGWPKNRKDNKKYGI